MPDTAMPLYPAQGKPEGKGSGTATAVYIQLSGFLPGKQGTAGFHIHGDQVPGSGGA